MRKGKNYHQQSAWGPRLDHHVAAQFADALSHPSNADARFSSAFVQLAQCIGRHPLSVVVDFEPDLILLKSNSDLRFRAAGVAVDVG